MTGLRTADRGSTTVETVVMAPVFALFLTLVVLAGRLSNSRGDVDAAAQYAARTISIARTPTDAIPAAHQGAEATLRVGSPTCQSMQFESSVTAAEVTVTISCVVDLSAASLLPVPGTTTITESAVEPRDEHREVGS